MMNRDMVRGCLFGGAVGDALGYAIEFDSEDRIFSAYGKDGITEYELTYGKALISDDTQMTLFTAEGILKKDQAMKGSLETDTNMKKNLASYVADAYQDWYKTQNGYYSDTRFYSDTRNYSSKLLQIPELYSQRAPGITCLSGLRTRRNQKGITSFLDHPINKSKGCGGVMRVAPLGIYRAIGSADKLEAPMPAEETLAREAAELAAITHTHSLGYMPASVLVLIISQILQTPQRDEKTLESIVKHAMDVTESTFAGDKHMGELKDIVALAIELSKNQENDLANIHHLGEGWVAEEALAIAIYCALKYQNDFSKAMIASVNHKGDSDSTGAVTGNILGAWIGYEAMEEKWKDHLELSDVILQMADELYLSRV